MSLQLVQITPGAGGMYCGNCFRDNALVAALRARGHQTLMLPLYLPMTLDEPDQSRGTPIFFGGINVYLEQQSSLFRHMPDWLHRWLSHPKLLKWASGRAAKTKATELGALTVSMLEGEKGHQARELEALIDWLRDQIRPDVVCLSNALLLGLARRLRKDLKTHVACVLQGEDEFLDALNPPYRDLAWKTVSERAKEVDLFIAPSQYYADLMIRRANISPSQVQVIPNGINLEGFPRVLAPQKPTCPTLGFFARMCREKGLDLLVDAWLVARKSLPSLRLKVGGSMGPSDEALVEDLQRKIAQAGASEFVSFHPNLTRNEKIEFLQSLTVFSVPARYSEAFGLYLIEAMGAGVPVVQPRHASFPEIIASTGGGMITDHTPGSLAEGVLNLLNNPALHQEYRMAGHASVHARHTISAFAAQTEKAYQELKSIRPAPHASLSVPAPTSPVS